MTRPKSLAAVPLVLALAASGAALLATAPAGQAATVAHPSLSHGAMKVTEKGKITAVMGMSEFKMAVGMHKYTVKVGAMTHITVDAKAAKFNALKKGDTVTVKGELEMGLIEATSVNVAAMGAKM